MQGRTHNCNQLRLENAGEEVSLVGWYDNLRRVSKNLGFLILRDRRRDRGDHGAAWRYQQ